MVVKLYFDSTSNEELAILDQLTSSAIRKGGTLSATRRTLDKISPYLALRVVGNSGEDLQMKIKETFDPKDVLSPSSMFYIREEKAKSWFQRLKERSKEFNYIFS